eukprot:m51a1_g5817 putative inositol hexakisphosphate kinase 3 (255) ;mRNA; f:214847-216666
MSTDNQVGGHEGALLFQSGRVYKPNTNPKEHAFYTHVNATKGLLSELGLVPKFYGVGPGTSDASSAQQYLIIEDVVCRFKKPCILDMKIGTRTWHDECTPAKREAHIAQDAQCTTSKYGFRFCGMKVWDPQTGMARKFPRKYGWDCLTDESMGVALREFLSAARDRRAVVSALLHRLDAEEGGWELIASSLLMAYEAEAEEEARGRQEPLLVMIDFAHATWKGPAFRDEGYLAGLDNLSRFLRAILSEDDIHMK